MFLVQDCRVWFMILYRRIIFYIFFGGLLISLRVPYADSHESQTALKNINRKKIINHLQPLTSIHTV